MTVGMAMKQCREKKKISQAALANKIGISNMTISYWETDRCHPSLILLMSVADVLNVTIDELVGRKV